MLPNGSTIGGFRIEAMLGRGAMGEVYRGVQLSLGRPVAIKRIAEHLLDRPELVARFEREAHVLARINHPNVVGIIEFGSFAGPDGARHHLLVMELVDGGHSLKRYVGRPMDWRQACALVHMAADGLAAAHEVGVVHRDVKPDNAMMTRTGIAKLCDFGLARAADSTQLTMAAGPMGTPLYMAPEAWRGDAIGPAADLYSLGCTWYQLLVGEPPFQGEHWRALMVKHEREDPPNALRLMGSVPEPVVKLVYQCLAKEAERRPASAAALVQALDLLQGQGLILPRHVRDLVEQQPQEKSGTSGSGGTTGPTLVAGTVAAVAGGGASGALERAVSNAATVINGQETRTPTVAGSAPSGATTIGTALPTPAPAPAAPPPPAPSSRKGLLLVLVLGALLLAGGAVLLLRSGPAVPANQARGTAQPPMKPVEAPKPPEPVKPVEAPKPVMPAEAPKPPEPIKPVEAPKPPEPIKPVEAPKPPEPVKPVEAPKPPEPVKPVEAPKPPEPVATTSHPARGQLAAIESHLVQQSWREAAEILDQVAGNDLPPDLAKRREAAAAMVKDLSGKALAASLQEVGQRVASKDYDHALKLLQDAVPAAKACGRLDTLLAAVKKVRELKAEGR